MLNDPNAHFQKPDYENIYFIGKVIENDDPKRMERLRIRIPEIHDNIPDDKLPWAIKIAHHPYGQFLGGTAGAFGVPPKGALLYVMLQKGDQHYPVYLAGAIVETCQLPEAKVNYPWRYGFKDIRGNLFYVDTKEGVNQVYFKQGTSDLTLKIDKDGNVEFTGVKNFKMSVKEDAEINVGGDLTYNIEGGVENNVGGSVHEHIDGDVTVDSGSMRIGAGNIHLAGGDVRISGSTVKVNGEAKVSPAQWQVGE
jgi:hypothetical protein